MVALLLSATEETESAIEELLLSKNFGLEFRYLVLCAGMSGALG